MGVWQVEVPSDNLMIELNDAIQLMGRYVIRSIFLRELSKIAQTKTIESFKVMGPGGVKKAEDYYALVKIVHPSIGEIAALYEKGYAGVRIVALHPDNLVNKTAPEILDIFENALKEKMKSWLWITANFPL